MSPEVGSAVRATKARRLPCPACWATNLLYSMTERNELISSYFFTKYMVIIQLRNTQLLNT